MKKILAVGIFIISFDVLAYELVYCQEQIECVPSGSDNTRDASESRCKIDDDKHPYVDWINLRSGKASGIYTFHSAYAGYNPGSPYIFGGARCTYKFLNNWLDVDYKAITNLEAYYKTPTKWDLQHPVSLEKNARCESVSSYDCPLKMKHEILIDSLAFNNYLVLVRFSDNDWGDPLKLNKYALRSSTRDNQAYILYKNQLYYCNSDFQVKGVGSDPEKIAEISKLFPVEPRVIKEANHAEVSKIDKLTKNVRYDMDYLEIQASANRQIINEDRKTSKYFPYFRINNDEAVYACGGAAQCEIDIHYKLKNSQQLFYAGNIVVDMSNDDPRPGSW